MAKLQFVIDGQKLKCSTPSVMVSDTIRYFGADFSFLTKAWAGLTKYAHFQRGKNVYDVLLTDDKISETEHEMSLEAGEWTVWVHGAEYDEESRPIRRITTTDVTFTVVQSGALEGEMFPTVLPSVGEQIVARATEQAGIATAEAASAEIDSASANLSAINASRSAMAARTSEQNAEEFASQADKFADNAEASMFEAQYQAEEARKAEEAAKQAAEEAKHNTYETQKCVS